MTFPLDGCVSVVPGTLRTRISTPLTNMSARRRYFDTSSCIVNGVAGTPATNLRVNVESIHHDVRPIGVDHLDLERMRGVGEPVRPEDGHLVALDGVALVEPHPRL